LILELASGGDLLTYMGSTPPPVTAQDIYTFWSSFSNVLRGLFEIHKTTERAERNGGGGGNVLIVHEDIKPENILLEPLDSSSSVYEVTAKIADFGYSSVRSVPENAEDKRLGLDSHGTPTYSAPEISHQETYMQEGRYRLSELADIWSMGCVLSELCVWVALGTKGRDEYTELRREETNNITSCKGSAYRSCFHNGIIALDAVATMHERAISALPSTDSVTRGILGVVTEHMLVISAERWPADTIRLKIGHILDSFKTNGPIAPTSNAQTVNGNGSVMVYDPVSTTATQQPSTVRSVSSASAPTSISAHQQSAMTYPTGLEILTPAITLPPQGPGSAVHQTPLADKAHQWPPLNLTPLKTPSTPPHLSLTLEDLRTWRHAEKNNLRLEKRIADAISGLKDQLRSRDHIFFFDNSPSMVHHRNEAIDAFMLLSYLAKKIDSNGIELVFSNEPCRPHKSKDTTPLIDRLKKRPFGKFNLMENHLGEFFQSIIIPRLPKPNNPNPLSSYNPRRVSNASTKCLSIFVLTDGQWGDSRGRAAGIETPVAKLMTEILDRRLNRTQVMLQFIRFGNDPNGEESLRYLDEFGRDFGCDIVDTEPINGNIFKIFIGSIDLKWDDSLSPESKETG
jgi:serine/threonine protein kinase